MIRRFNYTKRVKIARSRVDIRLFKDKESKYFKAKVDLEGLRFPADAKIYIEPNYKGVYQRFYYGTVSSVKEPDNTRLTELPETELAYFDISIVDESQTIGLLLGKARGMPVSTDDLPNDKIPLLYVNPTDLKNQFWKLTFDSSEDGRPVLEINNQIPDLHQRAKGDINFICLVYPIAFRGVLNKMIEFGTFEAETEHWITQWVKFIDVFLGIKSLPSINDQDKSLTPEQEEWIDLCVNEYSRKLQLFEKYTHP